MAYTTKPSMGNLEVWDQRLFIVAVLVILSGFVLYALYVAIMVTAAEQLKRLVMVSPLLLVVALHCLSSVSNPLSFSLLRAQPGTGPGGADGSPWGVALVLLLLLFLISYQPSFYPRWFSQ